MNSNSSGNPLLLIPSRCAICGTEGGATEIYPANFDAKALNPAVFSARRLPDNIHYRLARCQTCGLVRSDPIAPQGLLTQLYTQSTFTYGDEVADLRFTYGRNLARLERYGVRKEALLEIGCGTGFFLEEALNQGYRVVQGIEPSRQAVEQARPEVREQIVCGFLEPNVFPPERFDVICLFQVFDHLAEPGALLEECFRLLRPGGYMICINHNVEAFSARLLGERSPIVDIEHTYLYSPRTMTRIFLEHGFQVREVGPMLNRYSLYYLWRLLPLPAPFKRVVLEWLRRNPVGQCRFSVPLGNLRIIAEKPGAGLDHGQGDEPPGVTDAKRK